MVYNVKRRRDRKIQSKCRRKQFNTMERALQGKLVEREKGIAVRNSLTKALQQSTENDRMHGHAYSTYTNCIFKVLFGMNANQLKERFGISEKGDKNAVYGGAKYESNGVGILIVIRCLNFVREKRRIFPKSRLGKRCGCRDISAFILGTGWRWSVLLLGKTGCKLRRWLISGRRTGIIRKGGVGMGSCLMLLMRGWGNCGV